MYAGRLLMMMNERIAAVLCCLVGIDCEQALAFHVDRKAALVPHIKIGTDFRGLLGALFYRVIPWSSNFACSCGSFFFLTSGLLMSSQPLFSSFILPS